MLLLAQRTTLNGGKCEWQKNTYGSLKQFHNITGDDCITTVENRITYFLIIHILCEGEGEHVAGGGAMCWMLGFLFAGEAIKYIV